MINSKRAKCRGRVNCRVQRESVFVCARKKLFVLFVEVVMSFGLYFSIRSCLVHSFLFGPIRSSSVLFSPPYFYSVLFCPFSQLCSIWSNLVHLTTSVHFDLFLCTYIMVKDIFGLKALNLNPNLLKKI